MIKKSHILNIAYYRNRWLSYNISYHIIYFPHITFIYYKNIQIYCINIFLILNNKIHIGFWNEEGLAESHYGFVIKPLFVNQRGSLTGFWICLGFWICQRSEYMGILNIPGLWICQGSEHASGLNMSGFWIYHGSKYARVTQGFEYAWIRLNNSWIWLIMPECPKIFLDGLCFTFTHCNSLSKGTVDCFLGK